MAIKTGCLLWQPVSEYLTLSEDSTKFIINSHEASTHSKSTGVKIMFGLGHTELIVILVIGLIIFGAKKLQ
ncbi:MAG: twin-arginine translocase TatA/TatE family subunit [Desulfobacterales bacterium]